MAIQLVLLRPVATSDGKTKQSHRFTKPKVLARSIKDLFQNLDKYLQQVEPGERWNLFYTVGDCHPDRIREYQEQNVLAFDCDGIDAARSDQYLEVVSARLGVPDDHVTVVFSGNGLHFLVELETPIARDELPRLQPHYRATIQHLDQDLKNAGLPGHFDMIFDQGRILRLPETENRKPKGTTRAKILQLGFTPLDLKLELLSGIPIVDEDAALSLKDTRTHYSITDDEAVTRECRFLAWSKDSPREVKEPHGYAALSILPRLQGGRELAKQYIARWTGSSSIAQWDADQKIDQALSASGPLLCATIQTKWGKCTECPHFQKVQSPIAIRGPDFLATQGTGFYTVSIDRNGTPHRKPNYDDLLKFFAAQNPYFYQGNGKVLWVWSGTHYREWSEAEVKHFAETHFDPKPNEGMRLEFLSKVRANHLTTAEEMQAFFESSAGFLNLQNGVLDLRTLELSPHVPTRGFRYVLPYEYQPGAAAPRFQQFLRDISLEREWIQTTILDCLAALLMPGYGEMGAAFWWFQGVGSNGKSRLIELMKNLVGRENAITLDEMSISGPAARFRLADMNGKLLTVFEETNESTLTRQMLGLLKNISAGGEVPVERKGRDGYQMRATAKLVFTANAAPILEDVGAAVQRRFIAVPFDLNMLDPKCTVVHETEAVLDAKLKAECPGVLNLALQALQRLRARGKAYRSEGSIEILHRMVQDSDSVEAWIAARVQLDPAAPRMTFREVFHDYTTFVGGEEKSVSDRTFSRRLAEKLGLKAQLFRVPGAGHLSSPVKGYEGLALVWKDPIDAPEAPRF